MTRESEYKESSQRFLSPQSDKVSNLCFPQNAKRGSEGQTDALKQIKHIHFSSPVDFFQFKILKFKFYFRKENRMIFPSASSN